MFTYRRTNWTYAFQILLMFQVLFQAATLTAQTPPKAPADALAKADEKGGDGLYYLWSVQTKATVRDNFGHYIADRYFVVELLLNNQYA